MNSKLSHRLSTLVSLIDQSRGDISLWDIGCDHGHVGRWAGEHLRVISEVNFVDTSLPVINKLKANIDADIPKASFKINFHHLPGQELKIHSSKNVFLIAGMGGQNIIEILTHLSKQVSEDSQFIIGPHRDILAVRAFLNENRWSLINETLIEENELFYQLLSLRPMEGRKVSLYGEDFWQTPVGHRYMELLRKKLPAHRDGPSRAYLRYLQDLSP